MELNGRKIAIFVDKLYEDTEFWYPLFRFQEAGAEVVVLAAEAGKTYPSKHGYPAVSHRTYDSATVAEFDAVIVPGGYAPDYMRRYAKATQFVHDMDKAGKLVASICHGPWVLCSSNMLKGRRVTCVRSVKDDVVNAGARWEDAQVVIDANLVTSRTPEDLPAFCRACIGVLTAKETA